MTGTEISKEQQEEKQRTIDDFHKLFVEAVATGRGINADDVQEELADGRIYIAADAEALGLIDAVESFEEMLAGVRRDKNDNGRGQATEATDSKEVISMNTETTETAAEPQAASIEQLKKELPAAGAEFYVECLEMEATVAEAKDLWIVRLEKEKTAAQETIAKLETAAKAEGVEACGTAGTAAEHDADDGDAIAMWNRAINGKLKERPGRPRSECCREVAKEQPELAEAYSAAFTLKHPARHGPMKRRRRQ